MLGKSYRFRASLRDDFTHRLCDKNRDSASLPIRLFFRPSNIADAATSIFELPPAPAEEPPSPKGIRRGYSRRGAFPAKSIDLLADFPESLPRRKQSRSYPRALALSSDGDALYVSVADPLATRRHISLHISLPSSSTNFLPARRGRNFATVQLCELGSLRWIDSMFSLTQVIHLSCLRRPRAIDPDACVDIEWTAFANK